MTYTFKLSRRLAVSRKFSALMIGVLFAACTSDATGPESLGSNSDSSPVAFRVVPGAVTVETNQAIRFRGETVAGDLFASRLTWHSSGGIIDADGNFTASEAGTYKVIGRGRGRTKADTSVVVVVTPPPNLTGVEVSPDSTSVAAGATQSFAAVGRLSDGSTGTIGVTWS
ncbi:MAG TPA: hypothetical protein VMN37_08130, partial [Gemmatimonadales bacterium]|nr:hypothetical protein [Gemmatimonadales bacterium]